MHIAALLRRIASRMASRLSKAASMVAWAALALPGLVLSGRLRQSSAISTASGVVRFIGESGDKLSWSA